LGDAMQRETRLERRPAAARRFAVPICGIASRALRRRARSMNPLVLIRRPLPVFGAALVLGGVAQPAFAQEPSAADIDNLEVTMRLLPEGATRPDPVTRVIQLPEALRSRLGDDARNASASASGRAEGAGADIAGNPRSGALDSAARDDLGGLVLDAAERARELARGQGPATVGR